MERRLNRENDFQIRAEFVSPSGLVGSALRLAFVEMAGSLGPISFLFVATLGKAIPRIAAGQIEGMAASGRFGRLAENDARAERGAFGLYFPPVAFARPSLDHRLISSSPPGTKLAKNTSV